MDRFERDQRSGTQQTRDDIGVPGSGNFSSNQGQFDQQQDYTDPSGGPYAQQPRYQTDTGGLDSGQQRSDDWGQGRAGAGTALDPSSTSDQYGSSQRTTSGQTGGYTDPSTTGRTWQGDLDDDTTGSGGGKPSVTSKMKGTAEKFAGKVTGDPGMQARGQERKDGAY